MPTTFGSSVCKKNNNLRVDTQTWHPRKNLPLGGLTLGYLECEYTKDTLC